MERLSSKLAHKTRGSIANQTMGEKGMVKLRGAASCLEEQLCAWHCSTFGVEIDTATDNTQT